MLAPTDNKLVLVFPIIFEITIISVITPAIPANPLAIPSQLIPLICFKLCANITILVDIVNSPAIFLKDIDLIDPSILIAATSSTINILTPEIPLTNPAISSFANGFTACTNITIDVAIPINGVILTFLIPPKLEDSNEKAVITPIRAVTATVALVKLSDGISANLFTEVAINNILVENPIIPLVAENPPYLLAKIITVDIPPIINPIAVNAEANLSVSSIANTNNEPATNAIPVPRSTHLLAS